MKHIIQLNLTIEAAVILRTLAENHECVLTDEQLEDGAATHMIDIISQLNTALNTALSAGGNIPA